ncbi:hypothetical protein F4054_05325 [Candidatus Poribacteria bacterium]|nr:hypothetical protein [Candidatus Poribacteria bacterium]MYK21667.1 hypothetical protein [Candidatus Poribacteria bacterium]
MNKIKSILLFSMIGATLLFSVLASVIVRVVNAEDSAQQAYIVLEENCFRCHGNLGDFKETLFIEAYNSLIQSGSVAPGQPDASELYKRLLGPTENGAQMPPNQPPLTDEAIESIRIWIENGAPDWNVVDGNRSFITNRRILETIQHHIETLPIPNRAFARYFSTTHLYNAGLLTEPLQSHALALSKLINSLSWGADIVNPEPINAEQTLFYIDLRNYEWDINDAWTEIEKHYPYNIKYEGSDQTDLRDLFIDLQSEMDCEVPFVNMDWFIGKASEPPLYNEILALPDTDTDLETLLGVDVIDNLKNHPGVRVWRAGIKESGVSRHNRVVERHKARYGAYWKSYDFAGSDGKQNISDFPLSFIHDGGEVVFNLPNGLQAYHLFDAKGMRLDSAPTEIVSNQDASDPAVYNGISCIDCHTDGMKPFTDVIRPVIEAAQNPIYDKDYALRLYVKQAVMDSLVQDDTEHFLTALTKTGNSSGGSEPVSRFHRIYNYNALDAAHAAAAVGLPKNVFLSKIRERADLGLFLVEGDVVKRDTWTSIFDAVVHALNPPVVVSIPDVDSPGTGDITGNPDDAVYIPDPNLRAALARMLGQRVDAPITVSQMEQFTHFTGRGHTKNGVYVEGEALTLVNKGIKDLTGLEYAINLKELSVREGREEFRGNGISDLTPISGLTQLESLGIGGIGNYVSDLSPIANLTNIKHLDLGGSPISDLSPISNFTQLETISFDDSVPLTDISVLADMENLRAVFMWGPRFKDMSPLVNLPNIVTMSLCGNDISEIPSLKNAPKLKKLYVFGNNVSDVSILEDLTNLERLNLRNNNITDIAPLAGLTNLKWLDLTGNPIRDWTPLYELSKNTKIEPNGFAFSAEATLVALDSTFTFNIDALFVRDLTGWQCGISFDPNLLEAIEVIEGDFLSSDATQTFFTENPEERIDNENGLITDLSMLRTDGTGLNGSGTLLSIKFKAKKVGKVTFTPGDCTLGDSEGIELPSVVPNLEIEIVEELPTPEADIFTGPKWDVNMDGEINILDLIIVAKYLGEPITANNQRADVTGDKVINVLDLVAVANAF